MFPQKIKRENKRNVQRLIHPLNWAIENVPKIGNTPEEVRINKPQQIGGSTELFYNELLLQNYKADCVEFNSDKAERQTHYGRDGKADDGWDIRLNTGEELLNIDVKWDAPIYKRGAITLELYNRYGYKSFLLKGAATTSAHIAINKLKSTGIFKKMYPNPLELSLITVDLRKLRDHLRIEDDKYWFGTVREELTLNGNRVLYIPISLLKDSEYAQIEIVRAY